MKWIINTGAPQPVSVDRLRCRNLKGQHGVLHASANGFLKPGGRLMTTT